MAEDNENIISVRNTSIVREGKTVIRNLSFQLREGEFVYLIGKTGSGKSSILKTLYADLEPLGGSIHVAGYDLGKILKKQVPFLRRKLGIIFQDFELLDDRSVEENLTFVLKAMGWAEKQKIKDRSHEVLERVGLHNVSHKLPHQLSGGEQQRVAIARALLNDPLVILADEPTGNLDPEVAYEILDLFAKINQNGTAILMGTHNHSFLRKLPARVLYCEEQELKDVSKDRVEKRMG
ncbi:ATP-binding cassette domain-containing protein [Flammeovirgaceae bacterium SG7u.111]|nr:ATP-binding cassette domain-containing protein [Flammeovirgaceae bacterium SG7u.132]WPO34945.1 ATP-binding cassette domain-containing protein [Flammeovirgaceae bacterium SG7u.111]